MSRGQGQGSPNAMSEHYLAPDDPSYGTFEQYLMAGAAASRYDKQLESPGTKHFREHLERKEQMSGLHKRTSEKDFVPDPKHFSRPHSNGKDSVTFQFSKTSISSKRSTSEPFRTAFTSFAPLGYKVHKAVPSAAEAVAHGSQDLVAERKSEARDSIEVDPQPSQASEQDDQAAEPAQLDQTLTVGGHSQKSDDTAQVVNISSDPVSCVELADQADQDEHNDEVTEADEAPEDSGICIEAPANPVAADAATPQYPEPHVASSAKSNVQDGDHVDIVGERVFRPPFRHPARSPSSAHNVASHTSPVLDQNGGCPVKVTKSAHRGSGGSRAQPLPFVPVEEQTISDEDILMVLIHRRKETEKNLSSAHAKVRTLQARNNTLAQQNHELNSQLEQLDQEHGEGTGQHDKLLGALEGFKKKYYKLKDYARSLNVGMMELSRGNKMCNEELTILRDTNDDTRSAVKVADAKIKEAESTLEAQKKCLATTQSHTLRLMLRYRDREEQLAEKELQLIEERRRCRRLENHVTELSGAQQRLNTSLDSNYKSSIVWMSDVKQALICVGSSVAKLDTGAAKMLAEQGDTVKAIRKRLQEGPQLSLDEASKLSSLLQNSKDSHAAVSKALNNISNDLQAASFNTAQSSLQGISTAIDSLKPHTDTFRQLELRNTELELKNTALENEKSSLIQRLETQQNTAEKAVTTCSNLFSQRQKLPDQTQLIIKWQNASTNIAKANSDLQKAQEKNRELGQEALDRQKRFEQQQADHGRGHEELETRHSEALLSQRRTLEGKIGELESRIDHLKKSNKESEDQVNSTNAECTQQKHGFAVLQSKHDKVVTEVQQLRSHATSISSSLKEIEAQNETLRHKAAELEKLVPQAKEMANEIQRLKTAEDQLAHTDKELNNLKKSTAGRDVDFANQSAALQKAEDMACQLPGLQKTVNDLKAAEIELNKKLEHAETQAIKVVEVRKQLDSTKNEKSGLDVELRRLRPLEGQVSALTKGKDALAEEVGQIKDSLAQAQQQLSRKADLDAQLQSKDQRIRQLEQEIAHLAQLRTNLASLQAESQQKDSLLTTLKKEIERLQAKSLQAAGKASIDVNTQDLRPLPFHDEIPDNVVEQLANSQDLPEGLPRRNDGTSFEIPPQRRVADRSAKGQVQRSRTVSAMPEIEETQQHSQETSRIPDSLPNTQPLQELDFVGRLGGSDSPLSDIDEATFADWVEDDVVVFPSVPPSQPTAAPSASPRPRLRLLPPRREVTVRPSSSAMSEDLFSKHADGVSDSQGPLLNAHGHPSSPPLRQTVAPSELVLGPSATQINQTDLSPNRLRDGRLHGTRSTPQAPEREGTPDHQRPRVQPNSAMKRRNQDTGPGLSPVKRQKRDSDSVEDMQAPPSYVAQSRNSSRSLAVSRQNRGLIGSDTPSPGRTQRRPKVARKTSKNEKYNTRFGP